MANEAEVSGIAVGRLGRRAAEPKPIRARATTCWDEIQTMPVEIRAPDPESARALLGDAASHFRAELVETPESATVVRLRPAWNASDGWVFELLALVERWLEAHDFQVANVHHGSRSYVITAPSRGGRPVGGADPVSAA